MKTIFFNLILFLILNSKEELRIPFKRHYNEDLSSFNLPKDPWEYNNVEIVCAKCHTLGDFTYFNEVNKNN